jgi:hypothetical protein
MSKKVHFKEQEIQQFPSEEHEIELFFKTIFNHEKVILKRIKIKLFFRT